MVVGALAMRQEGLDGELRGQLEHGSGGLARPLGALESEPRVDHEIDVSAQNQRHVCVQMMVIPPSTTTV
jgi:hypothetical protein